MGSLQKMLDAQMVLQDRLITNRTLHFGRVSSMERLILNAHMAIAEAGEWRDALPWKPHKQNYGSDLTEEQREHVLEELVDLLHFVFNGFLELGVRHEEEIEQRFTAKNKVNHTRQDEGY